jgi:hypothetical protein
MIGRFLGHSETATWGKSRSMLMVAQNTNMASSQTQSTAPGLLAVPFLRWSKKGADCVSYEK